LVFFTSPFKLNSVFSSHEYDRSAFWFSAAVFARAPVRPVAATPLASDDEGTARAVYSS
jgi:hypothetical protein